MLIYLFNNNIRFKFNKFKIREVFFVKGIFFLVFEVKNFFFIQSVKKLCFNKYGNKISKNRIQYQSVIKSHQIPSEIRNSNN